MQYMNSLPEKNPANTCKMKLHFLNCSSFLLVFIFFIACDAATFQPFVRSRYSIRRRITTETVLKDNKIVTTDSSIETGKPNVSNIVTEIILVDQKTVASTEKNLIGQEVKQDDPLDLKTVVDQAVSSSTIGHIKIKSTPPPDYDYYGNGDTEDMENV